MTDRLRDLMQQRFGETVDVPSDITGIDQLETMLAHCSHRSFTSATIAPELLRLLYACALSAPTKSDLQQALTLIAAHFLAALDVLPWFTFIFIAGLLQQTWIGLHNFLLLFTPKRQSK